MVSKKNCVSTCISNCIFVQPICDVVPLNELSVDDYHQTGGGGGGGGRYTTLLSTVVV